MKYKISDVFFYEENNELNKLKEETKKISQTKKYAIAITLITALFGATSLAATVFTTVGINSYFFAVAVLCGCLTALETKYCLDLNNEIKSNNKNVQKMESDIKFKKRNLEKKINVFEKRKKNQEKTLDITPKIELADLKRKKEIIQDYIIHQEKYECYYIKGVLEAHLSKKYTKEEFEFMKLLITTNISFNEEMVNTNKKNKTKIK